MWMILRQRLAVLVVAIIGGALLMGVSETARAADGAEGMTLMLAGSTGAAMAWVLLVAAVVALLASVVGAMGNPIVGVFTLAVALTIAAVSGGSVDATLRSSGTSGVYGTFAVEVIVWMIIVGAASHLCVAVAGRLSPLLPGNRSDPDTSGPDDADDESARAAAEAAERRRKMVQTFRSADRLTVVPLGAGFAVVESVAPDSRRAQGWVQFVLCALVIAAVGGALSYLLMRSEDVGQIVGALIAGFWIGGMLGHQLFPTRSALPTVIAPCLAGVFGYVWSLVGLPADDAFLAEYFVGNLRGAALALPVYFASAGVAGAALGIGWSQSVFVDRQGMGEDEEMPEPHVEPEV